MAGSSGLRANCCAPSAISSAAPATGGDVLARFTDVVLAAGVGADDDG
jgi:hypothetical protein